VGVSIPYEICALVRDLYGKLYAVLKLKAPKLNFLATVCLRRDGAAGPEARTLQAAHLFPQRVQSCFKYNSLRQTFLAIFLPAELNSSLERQIFGPSFWLISNAIYENTGVVKIGAKVATYRVDLNQNHMFFLLRMVEESLQASWEARMLELRNNKQNKNLFDSCGDFSSS
jgi:hypothetical protein